MNPDSSKLRTQAILNEANAFLHHAQIVQNLVVTVQAISQRNAELEQQNTLLIERLRSYATHTEQADPHNPERPGNVEEVSPGVRGETP